MLILSSRPLHHLSFLYTPPLKWGSGVLVGDPEQISHSTLLYVGLCTFERKKITRQRASGVAKCIGYLGYKNLSAVPSCTCRVYIPLEPCLWKCEPWVHNTKRSMQHEEVWSVRRNTDCDMDIGYTRTDPISLRLLAGKVRGNADNYYACV